MTMTILLADDHALIRDGLKMRLSQELGDVLFIEASNYVQVRAVLSRENALDLGVLDLNMPHHGGSLEGPRHVLSMRANLPWVIVSAFVTPEAVQNLLGLPNVYAFVTKNGDGCHVLQGVRMALERQKMLELPMCGSGLNQATTLEISRMPARLQPVYRLIRQGKSNKAIARVLNLSEGTVKNYSSEIYRYLQVANRTQAANPDPFVQGYF